MAMQSCELSTCTALQQCMQETAEPEETVAEISLPVCLERTRDKQEQQRAPPSHADRAFPGKLCTDEIAVEVQQGSLNAKQEQIPKHLPHKTAAPLHSGSSFNFKRALQGTSRTLTHKGSRKLKQWCSHPKALRAYHACQMRSVLRKLRGLTSTVSRVLWKIDLYQSL